MKKLNKNLLVAGAVLVSTIPLNVKAMEIEEVMVSDDYIIEESTEDVLEAPTEDVLEAPTEDVLETPTEDVAPPPQKDGWLIKGEDLSLEDLNISYVGPKEEKTEIFDSVQQEDDMNWIPKREEAVEPPVDYVIEEIEVKADSECTMTKREEVKQNVRKCLSFISTFFNSSLK